MRLLCVVVLYKTKLEDSQVYKTFLKESFGRGEMGLYVYDNSPSPLQSVGHLQELGIEYVSDTTNPGISKAYNCGAKYAKSNGYDWIIFSDQDTSYPDSNYATVCSKIIENNPSVSLISPIVETSKGILSPLYCRHHIPVSFNYGENKLNPLRKCAVINSGMVVRVESFMKAGGYNEKVPLDYSDYQFIERLQKIIDYFYLANYRISQSFSDEVDNDEALFRRFKSICKSLRNFEGSFLTRTDMIFILLKRCLSLSIRKKSFKFIKILLLRLYD